MISLDYVDLIISLDYVDLIISLDYVDLIISLDYVDLMISLEHVLPFTACCIWSVIASFSNLTRDLFCPVPSKKRPTGLRVDIEIE